jgi:membrane associated rhomboid family serine protease
LIGLIPNVANTQHVVGLLLGVTWGFLRSGRLSELRRQAKFKRSQR